MNHVLTILDAMRRPRLLIQAARIGAVEYRRDPILGRLLGSASTPRPAEALMRLIDLEAEQNERRRTGDATYSISAHIEILIAMMGEARLLRAARG